MSRKIIVEHNGREYTGQIMTVKRTSFYYEDHGILTAFLDCEYPGGGVGVGGFCLDKNVGKDHKYEREGTAYGLDHLMKLMWVVGVRKWEDIPGKKVIVLFEGRGGAGASSVGLANIVDEKKVFILKEHAEGWRARGHGQD